MTTLTAEITIEVSLDHSEPDPSVGWRGGIAVDYISVPGFTDEQNETLWRSLRSDMEDALIKQITEKRAEA